METCLLLIFLISLIIVHLCSCSSKSEYADGTLADVEDHFNSLLLSANSHTILVVSVEESGDYLQFTRNKAGIQLDLPQITARQQEFAKKFRDIAQESGLIVITNRGSDNTRFLDINVYGNLTKITATATAFLKKLYAIDESTRLIFITT